MIRFFLLGLSTSRAAPLFAALIVVSMLLGGVMHAESASAETGRTLVLGGPEFPTGWMYLENGEVGGIRIDFFETVATHAGYSWRGELYPAKRLMKTILGGKVDLSMLVRNPLLEKPALVLTSSEPVYTENLNLYGQEGSSPVAYRSDLAGKSIVVMRGYGYGGFKSWLDDPKNQVEQYEADSFSGAIAVKLRRNVDYALLYDLNFAAGLDELAAKNEHELLQQAKALTVTPWSKVPVYFHLSRKALPDAEQVLEQLMGSFHTLQQEGVLPPVEPLAMPGDRP